jgi:hypothetical protein
MSAMVGNHRYTPRRSSIVDRLRFVGEGSGTFSGDDGYALIMTALMIIPLTIITAFAVDLGAWYAQAARTQRAADAASLAGVVWIPQTAFAQTASNASLSRNWFPNQTPPTCGSGATCQVVNSVQWKVTVSNPAPRYFSRIMMMGSFSITRSAVAAFNPPIPLGSPNPSFGNNLPGKPGCVAPLTCGVDANGNAQPYLWSSINAPYESHQNGDPFTTRCWQDSASTTGCKSPPNCSGCSNGAPTNPAPPNGDPRWNPAYRPDGYVYAVEAKQVGVPITVQIYDAACNSSGSGGSYVDDQCDSADTPTEFQMYKYSGTNYQINASAGNEMTDGSAPQNCVSGTTGRILAPVSTGATLDGGTYDEKWVNLCTFTPNAVGIYPLRVRMDNIPASTTPPFAGCPFTNVWTSSGCRGSGINSFSMRVVGASAQIYGINDMSIWTNISGSTASFYLADIEKVHAGKTVLIDLYDPGDGSSGGVYTMTFKAADALGNPTRNVSCTWQRSATQAGAANLTSASVNPCSIVTHDSSGSRFNNQWLRISIPIPGNYDCPATKCWWKVDYAFSGSAPTDRTVWALKVVGDPVHLVE